MTPITMPKEIESDLTGGSRSHLERCRELPWGRKADERQESEGQKGYLNIPRKVSDWQQR